MNNYTVSIIAPVYNVELYLPRCIESILAQDYDNWELILINDGSPDKSEDICLKYVARDSRIKYFKQENQGVSVARNNGIKKATGDIITFLDTDDWVAKGFCKAIVENWNDSLELLLFDYFDSKENAQEVHRKFFQKSQIDFSKDEKYDLDYLELSFFKYYREWDEKGAHTIAVPWARAFSRKFLVENNLYFPKGIYLSEDRVFNIECVDKMKFVKYIGQPLYHYFINASSASNSIHKGSANKILSNYKNIFMRLEKIVSDKNDTRYKEAYEIYVLEEIKGIIWGKSCRESLINRKKYYEFYKEYIKGFKVCGREKPMSVKDRVVVFCSKYNLMLLLECCTWLMTKIRL